MVRCGGRGQGWAGRQIPGVLIRSTGGGGGGRGPPASLRSAHAGPQERSLKGPERCPPCPRAPRVHSRSSKPLSPLVCRESPLGKAKKPRPREVEELAQGATARDCRSRGRSPDQAPKPEASPRRYPMKPWCWGLAPPSRPNWTPKAALPLLHGRRCFNLTGNREVVRSIAGMCYPLGHWFLLGKMYPQPMHSGPSPELAVPRYLLNE